MKIKTTQNKRRVPGALFSPPAVWSGPFLLIIWAALTYGGFVSPLFLPKPHIVLISLIKMFAERSFLIDIALSIFRITLGFILSVLLALPTGVLMGLVPSIRKQLEPVISAFRYIPAVALIPLCILWFGIGETEKVVVIIIGTYFQFAVMVADRVADVPNSYREVSLTLGATKLQTVRRVVIPSASPGIMDDCRVTFGWSWTYLVVAEIVGATSGIGHTILESQRFLRTDQVFGGVIVIGMLGVIADVLFISFHRVLFPWTQRAAT